MGSDWPKPQVVQIIKLREMRHCSTVGVVRVKNREIPTPKRTNSRRNQGLNVGGVRSRRGSSASTGTTGNSGGSSNNSSLFSWVFAPGSRQHRLSLNLIGKLSLRLCLRCLFLLLVLRVCLCLSLSLGFLGVCVLALVGRHASSRCSSSSF